MESSSTRDKIKIHVHRKLIHPGDVFQSSLLPNVLFFCVKVFPLPCGTAFHHVSPHLQSEMIWLRCTSVRTGLHCYVLEGAPRQYYSAHQQKNCKPCFGLVTEYSSLTSFLQHKPSCESASSQAFIYTPAILEGLLHQHLFFTYKKTVDRER